METTYKELAKKYNISKENSPSKIEEWDKVSELDSSSTEIKLLNTPELVELYISKSGINDNIKDIIKNKL